MKTELCNNIINQKVNNEENILVEITYANNKVKKYFEDYNKMKRKIPYEWVRTIKKHMDRLTAAECFGDFLKLGLGNPERLEGYRQIRYSLHVAPNARLIIEPDADQKTIMICTEIEVEGVSDYHGSKENWYIP
ncbi:hypothetical protein BRYFOR_07308 [Marvinbryantia formatexigens DSM 14469]|uniref:Plasmid maintenance system killer protein n=2 Tax=Marvinbryantia TaxID=248744 RepID=C6LFA6_9FIRM|nr:hypothetical protein BRYFOR_07308 [Marvinbryantia formatexigens DSM 14469]SDH21177.1 proteic killer suppression protein [Marvinbryantia formatexigens]